jgi:hypothetical protein
VVPSQAPSVVPSQAPSTASPSRCGFRWVAFTPMLIAIILLSMLSPTSASEHGKGLLDADGFNGASQSTWLESHPASHVGTPHQGLQGNDAYYSEADNDLDIILSYLHHLQSEIWVQLSDGFISEIALVIYAARDDVSQVVSSIRLKMSTSVLTHADFERHYGMAEQHGVECKGRDVMDDGVVELQRLTRLLGDSTNAGASLSTGQQEAMMLLMQDGLFKFQAVLRHSLATATWCDTHEDCEINSHELLRRQQESTKQFFEAFKIGMGLLHQVSPETYKQHMADAHNLLSLFRKPQPDRDALQTWVKYVARLINDSKDMMCASGARKVNDVVSFLQKQLHLSENYVRRMGLGGCFAPLGTLPGDPFVNSLQQLVSTGRLINTGLIDRLQTAAARSDATSAQPVRGVPIHDVHMGCFEGEQENGFASGCPACNAAGTKVVQGDIHRYLRAAASAFNLFIGFGAPWATLLQSTAAAHPDLMRPVSPLCIVMELFELDGSGGWISDSLYPLFSTHPLQVWAVLDSHGQQIGFVAHAFHPCCVDRMASKSRITALRTALMWNAAITLVFGSPMSQFIETEMYTLVRTSFDSFTARDESGLDAYDEALAHAYKEMMEWAQTMRLVDQAAAADPHI